MKMASFEAKGVRERFIAKAGREGSRAALQPDWR